MQNREEYIRKECRDRGLHALGTSYIHGIRAEKYKKQIRTLSLIGLLPVLIIGTIALSYGNGNQFLGIALSIAAVLSLLQATLSGFPLVDKWDDGLGYSIESKTAHKNLADDYKSLADNPPVLSDLEIAFTRLLERDRSRSEQEDKRPFTDQENRKGMRYALWIIGRQCATCRKVPESMTPAECLTCGSF